MSQSKREIVARRRRNFILALAAGLVLLTAILGPGAAAASTAVETIFATPSPTPTAEPTPTPEPTPLVEQVTFSATGDNLIHAPLYNQAAARAEGDAKYDFAYAYANMADFYSQYDVNWINQETLVNNELGASTYPCFSTPGECAEALYDIGLRVFALSNNHSYDKGAAGIAATRRFWAAMPEDVVTTGFWESEEDYDRIPMHTVNSVTIAYLSYTEHTNGIKTPSGAEARVIYNSELELIERQITLARQQADFVVVGMHWGVEYSHTYNENQANLAQKLADWGADLIVGTHPHVLQDAAWLTAADGREVFVAYSLGNFISTQDEPDRTVGAILTCTLQKTTELDGTVRCEVLSPALHPVVTHYENGMSRANCRTYLLRDYTLELAQQHGLRSKYSSYGYDKILSIVTENITAEYLAADWK